MFTPMTLIALTLSLQSAPAALQSVYTSLAARDCTTLSTSDEAAQSVQRCDGVGGYGLLVEDMDARISLTVVAPDGKKHGLSFGQVVTSGFSNIGEKAEWRVARPGRGTVPSALIVRVNAHDDTEHPDKVTSYLTVTKITPQEICVTDKIGPAANANEQARRAADTASTRPCLAAQE